MIYKITVNGQTYFKDFPFLRAARAWAIDEAGISIELATTEALYRHMHNKIDPETVQPDESKAKAEAS